MLNQWIDDACKSKYSTIMIILDNCSIHRSKKVIDIMNTQNRIPIFLPQYTPSLAPIELLFAKLKSFLSDQKVQRLTKWGSKAGTQIIGCAFAKITPSEIIRE